MIITSLQPPKPNKFRLIWAVSRKSCADRLFIARAIESCAWQKSSLEYDDTGGYVQAAPPHRTPKIQFGTAKSRELQNHAKTNCVSCSNCCAVSVISLAACSMLSLLVLITR
jgi:hypothetical protein